ncbi:uncharacterized protein LOC143460654 isoform X2 [Clavelina lepadiformis]|uniref:uncharacterized protein LOC143460654 isoform X2 n=1 Tax=Clavelina lepadiformis TaxID=159417 RepID=UPI004040F9BA
MTTLRWPVLLVLISYFDASLQIDSVSLESDSFVRYSLVIGDHVIKADSPLSSAEGKFNDVEVTYTPLAESGVILSVLASSDWIAVRLKLSKIVLTMAEKGKTPVSMPFDEIVTMPSGRQLLQIRRSGTELILTSNKGKSTSVRLSIRLANLLDESASLYLGVPVSISSASADMPCLRSCIHRVVINGESKTPLNDAVASFNIQPCQSGSPTDCAENYCSKYGICEKTVHCNEKVRVKEIAIDGKVIRTENSQENDVITINDTVQWLQFRFDELIFLHGLEIQSLSENMNVTLRPGGFKMKFYLQISPYDNENYLNYTNNFKTKEFELSGFDKNAYLAWPVSSSKMRLVLLKVDRPCSLRILVRGCGKFSFEPIALHFLPPLQWELLFQANLTRSSRDNFLHYGVANEKHSVGDFSALGKSNTPPPIRNRILDVLPAYGGLRFNIKLEVWDNFGVKSSWNFSENCNDKFCLCRQVQSLISRSQKKGEISKPTFCDWSTYKDAGFSDVAFIRLLMSRKVSSLDQFHFLPGVKIMLTNQSALITVNTTSQCATACLKQKHPPCTTFDVSDAPTQTSLQCRMATGDTLANNRLVKGAGFSTHVLTDITTRPDAGFQCKCVNQMTGVRCKDNNEINKTFRETVTLQSGQMDINCRRLKETSIIKVEFAQIKNRPNHGNFATTSVLALIQALCAGKQRCVMDIDRVSALLPLASYASLEVRYVCEDLDFDSKRSKLNPVSGEDKNNLDDDEHLTSFQAEKDTFSRYKSDDEEDLSETEGFLLDLMQGADETPEATTSFLTNSSTRDFTTALTSNEPSTTTASQVETSPLMTSYLHVVSTLPDATTDVNITVQNTSAHTLTTKLLPVKRMCPAIVVRGSWFRSSLPGLVKAQCPDGTKGLVQWLCEKNGVWSEKVPHFEDCVSDVVMSISNLLQRVVQNGSFKTSLVDVAQKQVQFLSSSFGSGLSAADLRESIHIIGKMLHLQEDKADGGHAKISNLSLSESSRFADAIQETVDTMLEGDLRNSWEKLPENEKITAAYDLTKAIDDVGFLLADKMLKDNTAVKVMRNTAFQVVAIRNRTASHSLQNNRIIFPERESIAQQENRSWAVNAGSIAVPLHRTGRSNLVFAVYKNLDNLLGGAVVDQPTKVIPPSSNKNHTNPNNATATEANYVINSFVISASLRPTNLEFLQREKIRIILQHKLFSQNETRCAFWKPRQEITENKRNLSATGYWSNEGCVKLKSNSTHTECECDHLTNFAILMSVNGIEFSETDEVSLSVITWVGCCLSVICLVTCWFCFSALHGLRSTRNSIHKNLCFTLGLAQIIFLLGADRTDYPGLCPVVAGALHYLFLTVFCWMLVEGLHIYVSLTKVFEIDKSSRLLCYYIFAYGAPTLVVAISAAIRYDGYGTLVSCWLAAKDDHLIWSFVGPALCVICVNVFFFCVALRVMYSHRIATPAHQTRLAKTKLWIKGSCVLLSLLGITWIWGVFYVDSKSVFMAYLFTICNSLQGVFIFIFHCLFNERVRSELAKYLRRSSIFGPCMRRHYHMTTSTGTIRSACVNNASIKYRRRSSTSSLPSVTNVVTVSKVVNERNAELLPRNLSKKIVKRRLTPPCKEGVDNNIYAASDEEPAHQDSKKMSKLDVNVTTTKLLKKCEENVQTEIAKLQTTCRDGDIDFNEDGNISPVEKRKDFARRFHSNNEKYLGEDNSEIGSNDHQLVHRNKSMPTKSGVRPGYEPVNPIGLSPLFLSMDLSLYLQTSQTQTYDDHTETESNKM